MKKFRPRTPVPVSEGWSQDVRFVGMGDVQEWGEKIWDMLAKSDPEAKKILDNVNHGMRMTQKPIEDVYQIAAKDNVYEENILKAYRDAERSQNELNRQMREVYNPTPVYPPNRPAASPGPTALNTQEFNTQGIRIASTANQGGHGTLVNQTTGHGKTGSGISAGQSKMPGVHGLGCELCYSNLGDALGDIYGPALPPGFNESGVDNPNVFGPVDIRSETEKLRYEAEQAEAEYDRQMQIRKEAEISEYAYDLEQKEEKTIKEKNNTAILLTATALLLFLLWPKKIKAPVSGAFTHPKGARSATETSQTQEVIQ